MPRTTRSGRRWQGGTGDEAPEDVVPALRSEQGARAVRRRTSAGERAGGAGGRASRGDVEAAGWGRRRSEFGEGGNMLGDGSVSAGWPYQPALTCPRDVRWTR